MPLSLSLSLSLSPHFISVSRKKFFFGKKGPQKPPYSFIAASHAASAMLATASPGPRFGEKTDRLRR